MSLTQSIGPFLEIKVTPTNVTTKLRSCSNTNCKNHGKEMNAKFCSLCGSAQAVIDKTELKLDRVMLLNFFAYDLQERLSQCSHLEQDNQGIIVLQPNTRHLLAVKFDSDINAATKISEKQREQDLEWFKEEYKDEIVQITAKFGQANVSLHWGLISYHA